MESLHDGLAGAHDFVNDYFKRLKNKSRGERRRQYASPGFPTQVESTAKALAELRVPSDLIKNLVTSAMEMRTQSQRMSRSELGLLNGLDSVTGGILADTSDSFLIWLDTIVQGLNQGVNEEIGSEIMKKIDADFSKPVQQLAEAISDQLAASKDYLLAAVESFRKGSKEEASVRTRKAWESCISFALTRLPSSAGLSSLEKKSVYVLEQIGLKDESKTVSKVKNLYEGRFLHALDSAEPLPEPELPFYIALTTGFVHLVDRTLNGSGARV
jgi:hypothetical protein